VNTATSTSVRRASRAVAVLASPLVLVLAAASPALADVPEGWSDPGPVSGLRALLVYVIAPLTLVAVISLLTLLPTLVNRAKAAPAITDPGPEHPALEPAVASPAALERAAPEHTSLDELLGAHEVDEPAEPSRD
jgi:hypothetical protein